MPVDPEPSCNNTDDDPTPTTPNSLTVNNPSEESSKQPGTQHQLCIQNNLSRSSTPASGASVDTIDAADATDGFELSDESDRGSLYCPMADTAASTSVQPWVIEKEDPLSQEAAAHKQLQVPDFLNKYCLAIYPPLRLLICVQCHNVIIPGDSFELIISHLRQKTHFLHGAPLSLNDIVLNELRDGLSKEDVAKGRVENPNCIIPPIPLIKIVSGVACPAHDCSYATTNGLRISSRHKHEGSSRPWPVCSMQRPYILGSDGVMYWQVQPAWEKAVQHSPTTHQLLQNVQERDLLGGEGGLMLRIPENCRLLHPAHEALDWDVFIGGEDGQETKDFKVLCGLVALPGQDDSLHILTSECASYFQTAQDAMRRQLHPTFRQWLLSEDGM